MSHIERIGKHFYRVMRGEETKQESNRDLTEEVNFISAHASEIRPLLPNTDTFDDAIQKPTKEKVEAILQKFETKILTWKRDGASPDARKILIEASQPANEPLVAQLIEHLRADPQCGEITLLTDNVAGQKLENTPGITLVRTDNAPVIADIPDGPYDSVLIMDEAANSAMPLLRESARSVFGARRLFYYSPIPARSSVESAFPKRNWDTVDTFLVADEFARNLSRDVLDVPESKLDIVGSFAIEAIQREDTDARRADGRRKLGIGDDVITAAYLGFPSHDRRVAGETPLNTSTYLQVVAGTIDTAKQHPGKTYALIVRTHPRARAVEPLPDVSNTLPQNLTIINGDTVPYDDVVYATDVICCLPTSTEAVYGYYRGRSVALCAFEGKGAAGEIACEDYGTNGLQVFEKTGRGVPMKASSDLVPLLENAHPLTKPMSKDTRMIERIKSLLLDTRSTT